VADDDLYEDIFDELYERATPGLEEIESTEYPEDVNLPYLHFIDGDEMEEIIEQYCEEYGVSSDRVFQVKRNVVLTKAPSRSLDVVDSARQDAGLEPVSEMLEGDQD